MYKKRKHLFFGLVIFFLSFYLAVSPLSIQKTMAINVWEDVGGVAGISTGSAYPISLAVDSNDVPYIAYREGDNNSALAVKKYVGNNWVSLDVPGSFVDGNGKISLKIGNTDNLPYVAYVEADSKVAVKKYDGSTWSDVGPTGFSNLGSTFVSLVLGTTDVPLVVYADGENSDRATAKILLLNNWVDAGTPDFSVGAANYLTSTISPDGTIYVAFSDAGSNNDLKVMKFVNDDWSLVGNAGFGVANDFMSLAFDSNNTPYITYGNLNNSNKITVKSFDGNSWLDVGDADFSAGNSSEPKLLINSNDDIYVAYSDGDSAAKTTVAKLVGDTWTTVGNAGFSTGSASELAAALNSLDQLYVAYSDLGISDKVNVSLYAELAPTITNLVATPLTDGSGNVTLSATFDDINEDNIKISYRFEQGACGTYDASQATTTLSSVDSSTYGTPTLDNSDSNGYQVQSVISSSGANTVDVVWDSKTDLPSVNGETYCIYVFANDATESSSVVSASVSLDNYVAAPTIAGTSVTKDSVTFSWSAVSGASSYYVQLNSETAISTTETTYTFSSLQSNTNYTVGVKAMDSYGNSSAYTTNSLTTSQAGGGGFVPAPSSGSGSSSNSIGINESKEVGSLTSDGKNFLVYIGSEVNFNLGSTNTSHKFTVKDLDTSTGKVTLLLQSNPITISLLPKEIKNVDLDSDGKNDIRIRYNDLLVNRIDLTFDKLTEENLKSEENMSERYPYTLLVKTKDDPKVYVLENGKKHWVVNESIFKALGYKWSWIQIIDQQSLNNYSLENDISLSTYYPNYTLIKYKNDPKVYRIESDSSDATKQIKRHIPNELEFYKFGFRFDRVITISESIIYQTGEELRY